VGCHSRAHWRAAAIVPKCSAAVRLVAVLQVAVESAWREMIVPDGSRLWWYAWRMFMALCIHALQTCIYHCAAWCCNAVADTHLVGRWTVCGAPGCAYMVVLAYAVLK
jgi:hypothetical protein